MDIQPTASVVQAPSSTAVPVVPSATPTAPTATLPGSPTQQVTAVQQAGATPTTDEVNQAVKKINDALNGMSQNNIEFSVDKDSGRTLVKIVDTQTNQVIRQIPSEETLQIAQELDRAQGLLFNQKA